MKVRLVTTQEQVLILDHTRGVLRYRGSSVEVDGAGLHADPAARIITDEPERVCLVLGVSFPDPQVVRADRQ